MDSQKPIRVSYLNNQKHKETQVRKVKLLMASRIPDNRAYLFDGNWNHKKTNAQKAMYSCGGYGGKCPTCKRANWGTEKNRIQTYEFQGTERQIA